jgi:hypothetical protein
VITLDTAFLFIEDESFLPGNLHQIVQVTIMLLLATALDSDVICDADGAWALR